MTDHTLMTPEPAAVQAARMLHGICLGKGHIIGEWATKNWVACDLCIATYAAAQREEVVTERNRAVDYAMYLDRCIDDLVAERSNLRAQLAAAEGERDRLRTTQYDWALIEIAKLERERDALQADRDEWIEVLRKKEDECDALQAALAQARAAVDILVAAIETHDNPRCGHCAYALVDARTALTAAPPAP